MNPFSQPGKFVNFAEILKKFVKVCEFQDMSDLGKNLQQNFQKNVSNLGNPGPETFAGPRLSNRVVALNFGVGILLPQLSRIHRQNSVVWVGCCKDITFQRRSEHALTNQSFGICDHRLFLDRFPYSTPIAE